MEIPLALIGWFFTGISAASLFLGLVLIATLLKSGDIGQKMLGYTFWNDLILAAIWMLGLAGGIGVLRLQPWGRYLLELFCWALIVLAPLSAATRLYALKRQPDPGAPPVNWPSALAGVAMIVVPIVAICAATIVTLRSPEVQRIFLGN
jgi:hypothetical protein